MRKNDKIMEEQFQKLVELFNSNPTAAIDESQNIICSISNFQTYQEFYTYHMKNVHMSTCQNEWSKPQLCIYCLDCAASHPACICLDCFLNGDHEGHSYVILNVNGNCDCGDLELWKKSGTCSKHRKIEEDEKNPENYLDEKLRTTLTDVIFKACFTSLKQQSTNNLQYSSIIIQFLSSFLKFGDGFRRLICRSLTEKVDFEGLIRGITTYSVQFNQLLKQFIGLLINDQLFRENASIIFYSLLSDQIYKDYSSQICKGAPPVKYKIWNKFWFHFFHESCIYHSTVKRNWDWVSFYKQIPLYAKEVFKYIGSQKYEELPFLYTSPILHLSSATKIRPNEETQLLFDALVTKSLPADPIISSFSDSTEIYHYFPVFGFNHFIFHLFDAFKKKPNLKVDCLFEELQKSIDISQIFVAGKSPIGNGNGKENENDKFVARFLDFDRKKVDSLPLKNFMSFHNGSKFIFYDTLVDSFVLLFKSCNLNRVKIARIFMTDEFQSLRIKLGIISLKSLLSFICFRQLLVPMNNRGLIRLYEVYSLPKQATKYFAKFIPVLQLLIGIQATKENEFSLKEFFAFEAAREIGIFDDFSGVEYKDENIIEKKKQMIFSFLYMSLLLVIERTLFNYNGTNFLTEQVVFALKSGVHSIEQLDKLYDSDCLSDWAHLWYFNDVLMDVATSTTKKENNDNDTSNNKSYNSKTSFYLKEEIEWKSISAINSINDQMALMSKEIAKDPSKLLQIPEFEPEETYFFHPNPNDKVDVLEIVPAGVDDTDIDTNGLNIRLKQFLFTPTVLAIVYHTLRSNEKNTNSDLNDHLAMNILILIAKFIKEENDEDVKNSKHASFNESTEIHYESLVDLITKLKQVVFNYKTDSSNNNNNNQNGKDSFLSNIMHAIFKNNQNDCLGNALIENTLDRSSFASLLKIKLGTSDLQPKSFIDILHEKGKIGQTVLDQISRCINLNIREGEIEDDGQNKDVKAANREKAKKLKAQIMQNYKNKISNYSTSDSLAQKGADSIGDVDNEVCSICSTHKKNEIYCYPVYLYRTKFPFIIDKPPKFDNDVALDPIDDELKDIESTDNDNDDDDDDDDDDASGTIDKNEIIRAIFENFPVFQQEPANQEERAQREQTFNLLFNTFYEQRVREIEKRKQHKKMSKLIFKNIKKENEENKTKREKKFCTSGANFIIQFSMCMHPVHLKCCDHSGYFHCPVDRSLKNCLLPCIDTIPSASLQKSFVDKNSQQTDELLLNVIGSINNFIDRFTNLFNSAKKPTFCVTTEFVKSISGLISTYEIRLRNISYCLDSEKTKLLPRNLFLCVWNAFRFALIPKMDDIDESNETKLTAFQLFVKRLIENDNLEGENKEEEFKKIVSSLADSNELNESSDPKINEQKKFLFLRRVCLAEYFLLDIEVPQRDDPDDMINWDDVLSLQNLSQRYKWKFESITDFQFKPFSFMKFPKEFLRFKCEPFKFNIQSTRDLSLFSIIDYNYLINNYDELSGEIIQDEKMEMTKNTKNLVTCDGTAFMSILKSFYGKKFFPSAILFVASCASQLIIIDQSNVATLDTFYVDKYGCTDIEYERSQPLFFNEEKYKKFIDVVLSGDFAYQLRQLE